MLATISFSKTIFTSSEWSEYFASLRIMTITRTTKQLRHHFLLTKGLRYCDMNSLWKFFITFLGVTFLRHLPTRLGGISGHIERFVVRNCH